MNRIDRSIIAVADMLMLYKNVSRVKVNQIEFLQFAKSDGIDDCKVTDDDIQLLFKLEACVYALEHDGTRMEFTYSEICRLFDTIGRCMITRVIGPSFNDIPDFRSNIMNVFRRGVYHSMKNIMSYVEHMRQNIQANTAIDDPNLTKSIIKIYIIYDIFYTLSTPHPDISEFRYFLSKNSDLSGSTHGITSQGELNRLTDIIYNHSIDSKIVQQIEEFSIAVLEKKCRCRPKSYDGSTSVSNITNCDPSYQKHVFDKLVARIKQISMPIEIHNHTDLLRAQSAQTAGTTGTAGTTFDRIDLTYDTVAIPKAEADETDAQDKQDTRDKSDKALDERKNKANVRHEFRPKILNRPKSSNPKPYTNFNYGQKSKSK